MSLGERVPLLHNSAQHRGLLFWVFSQYAWQKYIPIFRVMIVDTLLCAVSPFSSRGLVSVCVCTVVDGTDA